MYLLSPNLAPINFIGFRGPVHIYNIKNSETSTEKIKEHKKKKIKSKLSEIVTGNLKRKSKDQLDTIENIKNLYYNLREKVIKLYNGYAKIISEVICKTKQGTGLKILTPKQMFQRLPIALSQVKAGNDSENLLNEMRQIVYSLYQSKEITK